MSSTARADNQAPAAVEERLATTNLLDEVVARTKYSGADRDLMRRTVCVGASQEQFEMFVRYAEKTGLDPFARQIYLTIRKSKGESKAVIQTGIDGYRLIADRTRQYAGNDEPVFSGDATFTDGRAHPIKATVTVWKLVAGQRQPFTGTARWDEYFPDRAEDQWMWRKMPYGQLAKCAEALALRKAFPANLAGIYTDAEVAQAQLPAPGTAESGKATRQQRLQMKGLAEKLGMDADEMVALVQRYGAGRSDALPAAKAEELIAFLEAKLAEREPADALAAAKAEELIAFLEAKLAERKPSDDNHGENQHESPS